MSVITQFFPSGGGGGGGNETPTGIKIPADGIPVEILGVSGAGGKGSNANYYGLGGSGAVFHATNYAVQPGCTVPITIGNGGDPGGCPLGQGSMGGTTSFNYPFLPLSVLGGGGGAEGGTLPNLGMNGCPGGTGGGATCNWSNNVGSSNAGEGMYYNKVNEYSSTYLWTCECTCKSRSWQSVVKVSDAEMEITPWGCRGGFPGRPGENVACYPGYMCRYGCGGGARENASCYEGMSITCINGPVRCYYTVQAKYFCSAISGTMTTYTGPGQWGYGSDTAGTAGGLIIKWADGFGAATGFPGGQDISPATPGYYTYCFASSGSIELP